MDYLLLFTSTLFTATLIPSQSEAVLVSQVSGYARQFGTQEAHLVIFNRNPDVSWDDKILFKPQRLIPQHRAIATRIRPALQALGGNHHSA